jgi:hypothetical protein
MAIPVERATSSPCKAKRKSWTTPRIEALKINAAEGAHKGTNTDKHGSASGTRA